MKKTHQYKATIEWTGNQGSGTMDYRTYGRDHTIHIDQKAIILGSSDPAYRGDPSRHNPEELLVSSLSACHMLWYLHLCAEAGVVVLEYTDSATGTMLETPDGGGYFSEVVLHPRVLVAEVSMIEQANELHSKANQFCFIANSVNFPVHHRPFAHSIENTR